LPSRCQGDLMARQLLTDRLVRGLPKKPAPKGAHYDVMDSVVPGLGVRVSDTGHCTFVLVTRFPGRAHPTRRAIGECGAITLETARAKARQWLELIRQGKDPALEEERARAAEVRRQSNTFVSVVQDFVTTKLAREAKGREVERDIRRMFIPLWGHRPITDISAGEVRAAVKRVADEGKTYQAHNLLGYARRLFNWAIDQQIYGIESSPADRLKPRSIIGEREPRIRILADAEIRAFWNASGNLGYPYGPLFRLLLLTGQRRSEVGKARWSEFDLDKRLWHIPPARMKAGQAHIVPLCDDTIAVLNSLPRFEGDCIFTTTAGMKPVDSFNKAKKRVDELMLAELRRIDPKAKLPDFVIHDVRRSMRTGLSAIPGISDLVRELTIGHTKPGMHKIYDQHAYLDEKRAALAAWESRLRSIVNPPPANVVQFQASA
jgi:integrase